MKKVSIIIIIIIIIFAVYLSFSKQRDKSEFRRFISPQRGNIAVEFRVTGTVNPRNRLEIKPQIAGRIEDILVVEGQKVKKGEILAWMSSTDRAALLDIARSKSQDEYIKWQDKYKPTPIISSIDGFIIARYNEPGQTVTLNDVILVIADTLIIEANVDETDLRYIKLGQEVNIFLDAYPNMKFEGIVEHIAYESKIVNNVVVYKVKILPKKILPNFRAGMTATIEISADRKENVLLLPVDVIIEKNNKKYVNVKTGNNNKLELREVVTGISDGKKIEIISGVNEDDSVLMEIKNEIKNKSQARDFRMIPGIGSPTRIRR